LRMRKRTTLRSGNLRVQEQSVYTEVETSVDGERRGDSHVANRLVLWKPST